MLIYILNIVLRDLYLRGPSLGGVGFWAGEDIILICSKLLNTPGLPISILNDNPEICEDIIQKKLDTIVISVIWVFSIWCVYLIFNVIVNKYLFINPFLYQMEKIEKDLTILKQLAQKNGD